MRTEEQLVGPDVRTTRNTEGRNNKLFEFLETNEHLVCETAVSVAGTENYQNEKTLNILDSIVKKKPKLPINIIFHEPKESAEKPLVSPTPSYGGPLGVLTASSSSVTGLNDKVISDYLRMNKFFSTSNYINRVNELAALNNEQLHNDSLS